MPNRKVECPMETAPETNTQQLEASFDIVERQDQADAKIATLRSDVDEVNAKRWFGVLPNLTMRWSQVAMLVYLAMSGTGASPHGNGSIEGLS